MIFVVQFLIKVYAVDVLTHQSYIVSQVYNEINAQLIISKYKKNTMKKKRRASYKDKKISALVLGS